MPPSGSLRLRTLRCRQFLDRHTGCPTPVPGSQCGAFWASGPGVARSWRSCAASSCTRCRQRSLQSRTDPCAQRLEAPLDTAGPDRRQLPGVAPTDGSWPGRANQLRRLVAVNLPLAGATKQDFRARREGQQLAGTGFPWGSPQADLGRQGHLAQGQLPGAAAYSRCRPGGGTDDGQLTGISSHWLGAGSDRTAVVQVRGNRVGHTQAPDQSAPGPAPRRGQALRHPPLRGPARRLKLRNRWPVLVTEQTA